MRLPRKWVMTLGLLALAPSLATAGQKPRTTVRGQSPDAQSSQSNQQVADEIAKALKAGRLQGQKVQIEFNSGTATIKGRIASAEQRETATRLAGQVPGVRAVRNELGLMGDPDPGPVQPVAGMQEAPVAPRQSNQAVAQQIAQSLTAAGLGGYDIEIRCKDGKASLMGSVDSKEEAQRAQKAAESVPGVSAVLNGLTVAGRPVAPQRLQPVNHDMVRGMPPGMQGRPMMGPPGGQRMAQMAQGDAQFMGQGGPQMGPAPGPGGPQMGPAPVMGPQGPDGQVRPAGHQMYNQPNVPEYAWPSYAQHDNYAQVNYPKEYDASAWPYIGPFYPYPQVPLGWRSAQLVWDDGYWNLKFNSRTDNWWWFLNPGNWH